MVAQPIQKVKYNVQRRLHFFQQTLLHIGDLKKNCNSNHFNLKAIVIFTQTNINKMM